MPKEITYGDSPAFLLAPDGNEHPEDAYMTAPEGSRVQRRGVHVGWTKGRHVEVGVAMFDPSREMPSVGQFTSLDRDGINRLIRSLRKARDAAYGTDA